MTDMETAREIADGMKAAISSEDARELLKTRIAAALAKVREECAVTADRKAEALKKEAAQLECMPPVARGLRQRAIGAQRAASAIRTQNNGEKP